MNFYSVKVGQRTKRGHFNETYSFVCQTENNSIDDVASHWRNHYKGFDILVDPVQEIVKAEIKPSFSFGDGEKKEIRDYKKQIQELKNKLNSSKERLTGNINPSELKREARELYDNYEKLKDEANDNITECKEIVEAELGKKYKDFIQWVRVSYENRVFKYEMLLNGRLFKE